MRKSFLFLTPNVQIEGRAAFGASFSNAMLGIGRKCGNYLCYGNAKRLGECKCEWRNKVR